MIGLLNKKGNHIVDTRYMLAQLYQTQFMKLSEVERNAVIENFIYYIQKDDFIETIREFSELIYPQEQRINRQKQRVYCENIEKSM